MTKKTVSVIGSGSWGLAIALVLQENGHNVILWEFDKKVADKLDKDRVLEDKLPGFKIPRENIEITSDLECAVKKSDYLFFVLPSVVYRRVASQVKKFYKQGQLIVSATKGLEIRTNMVMTQIIEDEIPESIGHTVAFSGPSHAEEVAKKLPTTIVAACDNIENAKQIQELMSNRYLRVYNHDDPVGVQLSGAIKNIIAITVGVSDGLGYGDNSRAALITRGIVEIVRLAEVMNSKQSSIMGLAGVGDLIVTCTSQHSRNRHVGEELGKGRKIKDILGEMSMVAEGVPACESIYKLSQEKGISMPIVEVAYKLLFKNLPVEKAVELLMSRDLKQEGFY